MCFVVSLKDLHLVKIKTFSWLLLWYSKSLVLVLKFTSLKCPNFSSSHLDYFPPKNDGKYFPSKTVENIFRQKRWKIFSGGKCFPQSRWILSKSGLKKVVRRRRHAGAEIKCSTVLDYTLKKILFNTWWGAPWEVHLRKFGLSLYPLKMHSFFFSRPHSKKCRRIKTHLYATFMISFQSKM